MACQPAPSYANIHMAQKIDPKFFEIAAKYTVDGKIPIKLMKRFLDDIFMIYTGSVSTLHMFFGEINQIHDKLKFTMTHTTPENSQGECACEPLNQFHSLTHCVQSSKEKLKQTCTENQQIKINIY